MFLRIIITFFHYLLIISKVFAFQSYSKFRLNPIRLLSTMNQDIKPFRDVICTDAIEWLKSIPPQGLPKECGVFTSLPDISELPELFHGFLVKEYKEWFTDTADLIMSRLSVGNYIILLQSDVRMMNTQREVYEWIDKSHLTSIAADRNNCTLVWHKLVSPHFSSVISKSYEFVCRY